VSLSMCSVQADLDRYLTRQDQGEAKEARMKVWLKESGRVVDLIEQSMREDGDFDEFVKQHDDGFALIQLGLLAVRPPVGDFDTDWLKTCADRVCKEFIAQEYETAEEALIAKEWDYFE